MAGRPGPAARPRADVRLYNRCDHGRQRARADHGPAVRRRPVRSARSTSTTARSSTASPTRSRWWSPCTGRRAATCGCNCRARATSISTRWKFTPAASRRNIGRASRPRRAASAMVDRHAAMPAAGQAGPVYATARVIQRRAEAGREAAVDEGQRGSPRRTRCGDGRAAAATCRPAPRTKPADGSSSRPIGPCGA